MRENRTQKSCVCDARTARKSGSQGLPREPIVENYTPLHPLL